MSWSRRARRVCRPHIMSDFDRIRFSDVEDSSRTADLRPAASTKLLTKIVSPVVRRSAGSTQSRGESVSLRSENLQRVGSLIYIDGFPTCNFSISEDATETPMGCIQISASPQTDVRTALTKAATDTKASRP